MSSPIVLHPVNTIIYHASGIVRSCCDTHGIEVLNNDTNPFVDGESEVFWPTHEPCFYCERINGIDLCGSVYGL